MPLEQIGLRVFIASPDGLERERNAFRRVIHEVNAEDAHPRGVNFMPVGWEDARRRMGVPQLSIDEQVRECDYFVLVLAERWGSPPGDARYTSGVEEEYHVASECYVDPDSPMKDIVVVFRGVDEKQVRDPGDQLRRVLDFKATIEAQKILLYGTFDEVHEFEGFIRRQLKSWIRDHEEWKRDPSTSTHQAPPRGPALVHGTEAHVAGESKVEEAKELSKTGQHSRAEQILAGDDSLAAVGEYARVLRRSGRVAKAVEASQRLLTKARDLDDDDAVLDALENLGLTTRRAGDLMRAKGYWEEGIAFAAERHPKYQDRLGYFRDNLGVTLRKMGDVRGARTAHLSAIEAKGAAGDHLGMAYSYDNLGLVERDLGDLDAAARMHETAIKFFGDERHELGVASALGNLGQVRKLAGDIETAEGLFRESKKRNLAIKNRRGVAINAAQLSRLMLERGDPAGADSCAQECLEINESLEDDMGVATALELLGRIRRAQARPGDARALFEDSRGLFEDLGHELGIASAWLGIARADLDLGALDSARSALARAVARAEDLKVPRLVAETRELSVEIGLQA